jgi:glycerol-3-phosphate O-acyltransferase / dihydroxyacetone phosphate acyltransferase
MWLFPAFPPVATLATRIFYRLSVSGARVPRTGPVLLVANHPNALLDPFLVVGVAKRPVHFLAKAPLFSDPLIGWAVRGVGSLPVYRRQEDPAQMGRNEETFRAVHEALASGAAVGIFPEGISHDRPSLVPLKTGAARIALGAAPLVGGPFPIIPIGLVFESKQEFRSAAFVVIGEPAQWGDIAAAGPADADAVRELTRRIYDSLHGVTLNLQRHEDSALVAAATAVYDVEVEPAGAPDVEAARRITAAAALARLTLDGDEAAADVAARLREHMRTLAVLGMSPGDVHRRHDVGSAARWTLRRISPAALFRAVVAALGTLLFWVPYRLTDWMARRDVSPDTIATRKLLYGGVFFISWILLLAIAAGVVLGSVAALLAAAILPFFALKTLSYSERWSAAARDVRSFLVRRSSVRQLGELRDRQRQLGHDLRALYERVRGAGTPQPGVTPGDGLYRAG